MLVYMPDFHLFNMLCCVSMLAIKTEHFCYKWALFLCINTVLDQPNILFISLNEIQTGLGWHWEHLGPWRPDGAALRGLCRRETGRHRPALRQHRYTTQSAAGDQEDEETAVFRGRAHSER